MTQWYKHTASDYVCGVNGSISAKALADCLSANFSIPLQAEVVFTQSGFAVGEHSFEEIPRPLDRYKYDLFLGNIQ